MDEFDLNELILTLNWVFSTIVLYVFLFLNYFFCRHYFFFVSISKHSRELQIVKIEYFGIKVENVRFRK